MKTHILSILVLSAFSAFAGQLTLPTVFSDHMVLQRDQPVPVWGTADAGSTVTVTFADQKKSAVADSSKHWKIVLDPMPASSKPRKLMVSCNRQSEIINRQFSDVLVGEVWLCAGQSNMEWPMKQTENAAAAIAAADHPQIRLYHAPRLISPNPVEQIDAQWKICSPDSVAEFSGVAYYFGRKLHQDLDVPVGLMLSAWGGTRIEPWTPPCGFKSVGGMMPEYLKSSHLSELPLTGDDQKDKQTPGILYNSMLEANVPYAIRGAIWYQGEANHRHNQTYVKKTRALLNGWRKLWGADFPFYYVQIAPYRWNDEDPEILPLFWEAQSEIVKQIPGTGMAVVSDFATAENIHPPNKEVPGVRLALLAEANTYGMDVVATGPEFKTFKKSGSRLEIIFDSAEGLTTRDGNAPDWFEIADESGVFKKADAEIAGNAVVLSSPEVADPCLFRFAWHRLAMPNLVNGAGLPAAAFRGGEVSEKAAD